MAKVQLDIMAKDNASGTIKGVTKSMITASLAVEGIKIATKFLINTVKEGIDAFNKQQSAEKQLETVLKSTGQAAGLTANEIKNMASSLQELTTFGDEAILQGQNLLLTFTNIGKDVFPAATETILDMSQALGQDLKSSAVQLGKALNDPTVGITALSRVGVSFTEQQKAQIKAMQEAGDTAGAQTLILKELQKEFGGSAKAAKDTFGGAMLSLKNVQGDVMEQFGRIADIVGRDIVKDMEAGAKAFRDFISDSNNIGKIAAGFEVFKQIIMEIGKTLKDVLSPIFKTVGDNLATMSTSGKTSSTVFNILGGVMAGLSSVLKVVGVAINGLVQHLFNLINIAVKSAEVFSTAMKILKGEADFKDLKGSFTDLGDSFVKMGTDLVDSAKNIVTVAKEEFGSLVDNSASNAAKYEKIWTDVNARVQADFKEKYDENDKIVADSGKKQEQEIEKSSGKFVGAFNEAWDELETPKEKFSMIMSTFQTFYSNLVGVVTEALSLIQEAMNTSYEEQYSSLSESLANNLSAIDSAAQAQMELEGVQEETRQQKLAQEIADLQNQIMNTSSIEDKAALEAELKEKEAEKRRLEILTAADKKKNDAQKKAAKEEQKLKKEQYEKNKAFAIANIWINAATAVIGWWAAFASMGIPGIVLAGVMTAATLVMAGVQTGLVASQSFADGGIVAGSSLTGDRVNANLNSGEAVIRKDKFDRLMNIIDNPQGMGGSGFTNNGSMTIVANNPEEFRRQLIEIERFEGVR